MGWRVEFSSFNGMMRWNVVGCEFWQNRNRRACAKWTLLVHLHFVVELRINIFFSHCNTMCAMYEQWGGATQCFQVCPESAGRPRWCWLRTCLGGIQWEDFWWFPNSSTHQIDLVWIKVPTFFRRIRVLCVVVTSIAYIFVKVSYLSESMCPICCCFWFVWGFAWCQWLEWCDFGKRRLYGPCSGNS